LAEIADGKDAEGFHRQCIAQFKTPLASIRGYAETLIDAAAQDPEHTRDFWKRFNATPRNFGAGGRPAGARAQLESDLR
jgi:signal transduction histidine kinase